MPEANSTTSIAAHGALRLSSVEIDSYNVEAKDEDGFIGDRASKAAFREIIEKWRKPLRAAGGDPFGDKPSDDLSKKNIDEALISDDMAAASVIHGAVEDFSQALASVVLRFMKLKGWKDTERVVVGGGLRDSRAGELIIARTMALLGEKEMPVELVAIRNDPDEAGLIGAAHLAPSWLFKAHDAILAVDIGGTNIRAGVVDLNMKKDNHLSKACVWKYHLWRHGDDENVKRDDAVQSLVEMLEALINEAGKEGYSLAPFIGIGCPGKIDSDGSIEKGAQNLPGNWESSRFNLPRELAAAIPTIDDHDTAIVLHNDAVVQGLSETPFMQDVTRWGVLTIGTGLGNARFSNRAAGKKKEKE